MPRTASRACLVALVLVAGLGSAGACDPIARRREARRQEERESERLELEWEKKRVEEADRAIREHVPSGGPLGRPGPSASVPTDPADSGRPATPRTVPSAQRCNCKPDDPLCDCL